MGSWAENARRAKLERAQDPPEGKNLQKRTGAYPLSKKTLLDRLNAARVNLLRAIEWREEDKSRGWWDASITYWGKQYHTALTNARNAGIDIKA